MSDTGPVTEIPEENEFDIWNDVYNHVIPSRGDRGALLGAIGSLTYPLDLDPDERIKFEIFKEYKFDRTEVSEIQPLVNIYLPIPQNLGTQYSVAYEQEPLGVIGMFGAEMINGDFSSITNPDKAIGGVLNLLSQGAQSGGLSLAGTAIGNALGNGGAAGIISGLASGSGAQNAIKGAMFGKGVAANPHMAQVFRNVNFRTHTFDYKFAPKSLEESNALQALVKAFKIAMHPRYFAEKHFFDYPLQFDIDILDGNNAYLFDVGPSVLTNFTFDPTPNGPHFHFVDGQKIPVAVHLTMTFTELKIVTQDEIASNRY